MELFSRSFNDAVKNLFETPNLQIIATIPVAKGKPIPLIENLRSDPKNIIITVRINKLFITSDY